ncbi:MAG: hypothetical protein KGI50_07035, partial [Patescibacteria group bacterium]|nr:hypothetical protein [Patescibacteria group bacterium]
MTDNTVVIYHGGCYDGFCCAWIARKFYPNANFVHSYYDDKLPDVIGKDVYILDYSFPPDILTQICDVANRVVLCDHHKTFQPTAKIFKHYKLIIKFDNMKSGARLTWEHFFGDMASHWLVDYTEDRDLWNWKLP